MRIAIVHSRYQNQLPSGENNAVESQASALQEAGHSVRIFSRATDDFLESPFYKFKSGISVATGLGPSPVTKIRQFQPDIVHVHNLFPNWSESWVDDIDIPLTVTIHNYRHLCSAGTLYREGKNCSLCPSSGSHHAVINKCYKGDRIATIPLAIATRRGRTPPLLEKAARIIFLSELSLNTFLKWLPLTPERRVVIPNFVDATEEELEPSLNHNGRWVFAGRLSPEKGVLQLIQRWPENIGLDIIGEGPLARECQAAALGKNVAFHGLLPHDKTLETLGRSAGLVFPSVWREVCPLIYVEALALGIPTIAVAGNAVAEDIVLGGSGLVLDSNQDYFSAIEIVLKNRLTFSVAALSRFSNHFSKEVWLQRTTKLYENLASE